MSIPRRYAHSSASLGCFGNSPDACSSANIAESEIRSAVAGALAHSWKGLQRRCAHDVHRQAARSVVHKITDGILAIWMADGPVRSSVFVFDDLPSSDDRRGRLARQCGGSHGGSDENGTQSGTEIHADPVAASMDLAEYHRGAGLGSSTSRPVNSSRVPFLRSPPRLLSRPTHALGWPVPH